MKKSDSNVDRVYAKLRQLAANFEFKPDARINESALSSELGASRTPLREALNRLVAEGFLTFQSGRGFFCRSLSPILVLDLYEARVAIETETVRLACRRASDNDLTALRVYLDQNELVYCADSDPKHLLDQDEAFHMKIAHLSGNDELVRILNNLNDRVRYIRLIYLNSQMAKTVDFNGEKTKTSAHRVILEALIARDENAATATMRQHIERRREDAAKTVRIAYSQLYVPDDEFLMEGRH